ncbi:C-terminal-binding protein 2 [Balamuthia mandrillaris]
MEAAAAGPSSLPLVVMLDFLDEADIEQKVLDGVARVECWKLNSEAEIPEKVVLLSLSLSLSLLLSLSPFFFLLFFFLLVLVLHQQIAEASAVFAWHLVALGRETIEHKLKNTKVIVRIGAGFDSVDLAAAGERGIAVANVPDYGVEEVADSAMSHVLNLMRKTHQLANMVSSTGGWPTHSAHGATRLRGKTFVIIGLGKIGKAAAMRAKAFGFQVLFYDPYVEDGLDKALGIERVDTLQEAMVRADVLSLHCLLDRTNHHLLDSTAFSFLSSPERRQLKGEEDKGIFLVNTARGGLIEEAALLAALKDGRVRGAALDVLEEEPYVDGHLKDVPNLIITPHTAFYSDEAFVEMRTKAALEVKRVLTGESGPRNCVNKQFLRK